jgi:hypothetical protein
LNTTSQPNSSGNIRNAADLTARPASRMTITERRCTDPLKGFAQNQIWCEIVALACELIAWTQMLALTGDARRWEPKRLRLRIFSGTTARWKAARASTSGRHLKIAKDRG